MDPDNRNKRRWQDTDIGGHHLNSSFHSFTPDLPNSQQNRGLDREGGPFSTPQLSYTNGTRSRPASTLWANTVLESREQSYTRSVYSVTQFQQPQPLCSYGIEKDLTQTLPALGSGLLNAAYPRDVCFGRVGPLPLVYFWHQANLRPLDHSCRWLMGAPRYQ